MNDSDGALDGRLASGTEVNGTLKFDRAVQIDGRFEGHVKSGGKLILGPNAVVDADIAVGELEVQGTLRGKVKATNRLLIRQGGTVEANIVAGKLAIEHGAVFRGNCEMPSQGSLPEGKSGGGKPETKTPPQGMPAAKPPSDASKGATKH